MLVSIDTANLPCVLDEKPKAVSASEYAMPPCAFPILLSISGLIVIPNFTQPISTDNISIPNQVE